MRLSYPAFFHMKDPGKANKHPGPACRIFFLSQKSLKTQNIKIFGRNPREKDSAQTTALRGDDRMLQPLIPLSS